MAIKPTDRPIEYGVGTAGVVNGFLWFLVVFGFVHWNNEQFAAAAFVGNLIMQGGLWFFLKITTTPRANPKAADGTPLAPVPPMTRGIEKG